MLTWRFDTCPCAAKVDRDFNFIEAINICDAHRLDSEAESWKAAHENNMAINMARAAEEIEGSDA